MRCFRQISRSSVFVWKKEIRVLLRSSMLLRDVDVSDECTMPTVIMYLVACICELCKNCTLIV